MNTAFCRVGRGGNRGWHAADLEVDFEAGKTYYIGYDHKSTNRDEWKLVRWGNENPWDLYKVSEDPTEINNLAETFPDTVKALEKLFLNWEKETGLE